MKFCSKKCVAENRMVNGILQCKCGEDIGRFDWLWSVSHSSSGTGIANDNKDVLFHPSYSSGTAAAMGDISFQPNLHYYWEIKITSNMYGTDVMIGVGTSKVVFREWRLKFCSLLGIDSQSWGYSYHGRIQHDKLTRKYGSKFGLGSIIGVHLNMCKGSMEYYLNRKPLGVAFTGMKNYELYPMVSSTAAQSAVRLIGAVSEEESLQMICLKLISKHKALYETYQRIPGLKKIYETKYVWIVPDFEEDIAKRLAEMEDNLMCPLGYSKFLKTKKLKTLSFIREVEGDDTSFSIASDDSLLSDVDLNSTLRSNSSDCD